MLNWDTLNKQLTAISSRHLKLASIFQTFARNVHAQVTVHDFHIKGISVTLNAEEDYFTITFVGKELRFSFGSILTETGSLEGRVRCDRIQRFPSELIIPVGEVQFTGSGNTGLFDPDNDDPITLSDEIDALKVVLNLINDSLSK